MYACVCINSVYNLFNLLIWCFLLGFFGSPYFDAILFLIFVSIFTDFSSLGETIVVVVVIVALAC